MCSTCSSSRCSRCLQEIWREIPRRQKKWSFLGWSVHRSSHRAGANEKHENQWWPHKRARDDRTAACKMAPHHVSLHWSQWCHARAYNYHTGEQIHDVTNARQARHMKDTNNYAIIYMRRKHFSHDPSFRNVSWGTCTHWCECLQGKDHRKNILDNMDGKNHCWIQEEGSDNHLKQAILSDDWWHIIAGGSSTTFPVTHCCSKASRNLASVFKYELFSHPPALFLMLRQLQKPVLAHGI